MRKRLPEGLELPSNLAEQNEAWESIAQDRPGVILTLRLLKIKITV